MANTICHHDGRYNIYCSISDGFYWKSSISYDQLKEWYRDEYGRRGMLDFEERVKRAKETGTSCRIDRDGLESFLCVNRAGENESFLSIEECIKRFLS